MGCTSKPAVVPVAKTEDDPRCEKFYEFVNKREDIDMEGFEDAKEALAKELGLRIDKPYDMLEISIIQKTFEEYKTICNEIIACNQKEYCISFKYSDGSIWSLEF